MKSTNLIKQYRLTFYMSFLLVSILQSQIRIVNSVAASTDAPNSSAFIDASSIYENNITSNIGKGLLFPRTDLTIFTAFNGIINPTPSNYPTLYDGLIVYNTANSGVAGVGITEGGTLMSGYWYYDNKSGTLTGGTWRPLSKAGIITNSWSLTGNAITANNFLGTLNAQPLRLFTNNIEAMRITYDGRVGIGIISPTAKLHVNGQVQITDGTQGTDKIFVSDNNGVGSWKTPASTREVMVLANMADEIALNGIPAGGTSVLKNFELQVNTISGASFNPATEMVALPQGVYEVMVSYEMNSPGSVGSGTIINSYFIDFPTGRVHSNSPSIPGYPNSVHSALWATTINGGNWYVHIGRGIGGTYGGYIRLTTSSRILIKKVL